MPEMGMKNTAKPLKPDSAETRASAPARIGSQKHYRANPAAPVSEELRGIVTRRWGRRRCCARRAMTQTEPPHD